MIDPAIKVLLAYLLGSLMGSLLIGRLRGTDIRQQGSQNPGATNAWRTQGAVFGLAVLGIDIGKGVLAALWLPGLALPGVSDVASPWLPFACGLAAILGHVYPLFFGFNGGKGAATLAGIYACLLPTAALFGAGAWLVTLLITGMVGLSTILAAAMITVITWIQMPDLGPAVIFAVLTLLLVLYTHRENIRRMRLGNENRFERVRLRYWLLGRR